MADLIRTRKMKQQEVTFDVMRHTLTPPHPTPQDTCTLVSYFVPEPLAVGIVSHCAKSLDPDQRICVACEHAYSTVTALQI